jgi:hypothetical protein
MGTLALFAKRIALLWRGRLLAAISVGVGMIINILAMGFFYGLVMIGTTEHRLALCEQWDSGNQGQWSSDPRCGYTAWHWAVAVIPGGGAGLIYWLVIYGPRSSRISVSTPKSN